MTTPNQNLVERLISHAERIMFEDIADILNEAAQQIQQLEARLSAQGNAADQEEAKALSALQDRLDLIYRLCCGTAPKQSVGELVAVMQKMPEWETVSAALATRAADPALIPDTPTTRFMLAEALQADPVTVQPAHNFSDWGYCTTCGRHTDTVQAIGMSCNGAAKVSGMPTQPDHSVLISWNSTKLKAVDQTEANPVETRMNTDNLLLTAQPDQAASDEQISDDLIQELSEALDSSLAHLNQNDADRFDWLNENLKTPTGHAWRQYIDLLRQGKEPLPAIQGAPHRSAQRMEWDTKWTLAALRQLSDASHGETDVIEAMDFLNAAEKTREIFVECAASQPSAPSLSDEEINNIACDYCDLRPSGNDAVYVFNYPQLLGFVRSLLSKKETAE